MGYKEFLNQWWILKEVSRKDGKRERADYIYHNNPFCCSLHLVYNPGGRKSLHFDYFEVDDNGLILQWEWKTSRVESIEESEREITFITRNTHYTFEKTDYNPLETEEPERMN